MLVGEVLAELKGVVWVGAFLGAIMGVSRRFFSQEDLEFEKEGHGDIQTDSNRYW